MEAFSFYKMSGAGNDFIVIDNRQGEIDEKAMPKLAKKLCRRRLSVGADGLIFIQDSDDADFSWRFFNADGSRAEMCGNGARCAARVARTLGLAGDEMTFITDAGPIHARVRSESGKILVSIDMGAPRDMKLYKPLPVQGTNFAVSTVNTGVPHAVLLVDDVEKAEVLEHGRLIRHHQAYAPAGTNVNFMQMLRGSDVLLRTYERGVEGETLACGTGAVAAALVAAATDARPSPVRVHTKSGAVLLVHYKKTGRMYHSIRLEGDARIIYKASLGPDALNMDEGC